MVLTITIAITLEELVQLGLLTVAVISLVHTLRKDRKTNRKKK